MMRALFSGVAGLRTHQTRMDVIGNNIANVNTTAYKSQSMTFSDLMYQTTQAASGANAVTGVGGVNARQIGLGAKTSAIKTAIAGQGSAQTTNDPFDIMISGDAFFVVSNGSENFFTRDGSFYVDGKGNLAMTSTGYNVMGWGVDPENENNIKKGPVQPLRVMTLENMTYPPEATTLATVGGIVDKFDTDIVSKDGKLMDLDFFDNQGYRYTARMSVHEASKGSGDEGKFTVQLDDILDSEGKSLLYQMDDDGNYVMQNGPQATDKDGKPLVDKDNKPIYTQVKTPLDNQPNILLDGKKPGEAVELNYVNGKGTFDGVGAAGGDSITLTFGDLPNFSANGIKIDFSATFNYNKNGVATISALAGAQDGLGEGRRQGDMSGLTVQRDGKIYATYTNGQRRLLGQISTATFANASGLSKEGDNLYSSTMNSGEFDGVGEDITAGGGKMESGVLEMSNVDLAAEFTEMITTQRGFQANSRIITVSDTLLEELTNLKR